MARLLAVTLGPTHGVVFNSTVLKPIPEPITDAATIARRITALPDRAQDVGAMLLRSLVWRVHQRIGDGTATTAVLAQSILEQANRYVAAGANPVRIQAGIQKATLFAIATLQDMAFPVTCQEQLASIAYCATREPELSYILGEMFNLLGEHAHVEIEKYMAPYLEREYIDGGQWLAKLSSPHLISAIGDGKAVSRDCNVVLFNGNLTSAEDVLPLIKILSQSEQKNLLLAAQKISDAALNTLVATYVQNKQKLQIVLVDMVQAGEKALDDLQDLSLLTGAKLFNPVAGDQLAAIKPADMGNAQRVEANTEYLRVSGVNVDPALVSKQINALQKYLRSLDFDDSQIAELKLRLGRLSGSMGILKIGAHTQNERDVLQQKAQQGVYALQAALDSGILPGGGTAYLHCISPVEELASADEDECMGYRAVARALRRPFEQLLQNAGESNSGRFAHEIMAVTPGLVYDILERKTRPATESGVLDAVQTLIVALETASSGAQMALSTDVLVLRRKPKISYKPG
jgi:chaperonin GroEL